jgi:hypothetical protein
MAITSGVRAPRAQAMIGGQSFGVLSATGKSPAPFREGEWLGVSQGWRPKVFVSKPAALAFFGTPCQR